MSRSRRARLRQRAQGSHNYTDRGPLGRTPALLRKSHAHADKRRVTGREPIETDCDYCEGAGFTTEGLCVCQPEGDE